MRKYKVAKWLILIYLLITISCSSDYEFPDEISNEIKISCHLTDLNQVTVTDTTPIPNVWVTSIITNGCADRQFNSYGQCWCFNTDTLPTIKSSKDEIAWGDIDKIAVRQTKQGFELYYFNPVRTGIPVLSDDTKLIVRGFIILNDDLIFYSDPLILNNPIQYAN